MGGGAGASGAGASEDSDDWSEEEGWGDEEETGEPFECVEWGDEKHELGRGDPPPPVFVDVTAELGLEFSYFPGLFPDLCPMDGEEYVFAPCAQVLQAAGVAAGDIDDDGDLDLYLTRLESRDALFIYEGGVYTDVAAAAGIADFAGSAPTFVDLDNDGDLDIYVSSFSGRNYMYLKDDDALTFTDHEGDAAMIDGQPHYGYGTALGDFNRDGQLDMYTSDWRSQSSLLPSQQYARLWEGTGQSEPPFFIDRTATYEVDGIVDNPPGVRVLSPAFVDLDENGWQDLALVSDGTTRLYFNENGSEFTEFAREAGVNLENNAMGSTFGDIDGDGHLDWYVTAIFNVGTDPCEGEGFEGDCVSGNRLYRNEGPRCFDDISFATGTHNGYWGWGAALIDFDNDGDLDLVETNGFHVPYGPPSAFFVDRPMRAWQNDGLDSEDMPIFTDVGQETGLSANRDQGRGLLPFDYDGDGDLDLLVTDNGPNLRLYRNDGGNDFCHIDVRLVGETSEAEGLGARLKLRRFEDDGWQVREMGANVHFSADMPRVVHFGLGPGYEPGAETIDELVVQWPASGKENRLTDLEGCQTIVVYESDAMGG